MPLINPEIQRVLRSAGLDRSRESSNSGSGNNLPEKSSLETKLDTAGLGLEDTLQQLSHFTYNATSDNLRLRAIEDTLKLHQVLKDTAPAVPQVTIIIQDPLAEVKNKSTSGVNPILIPRQLLKSLDGDGDGEREKETVQ